MYPLNASRRGFARITIVLAAALAAAPAFAHGGDQARLGWNGSWWVIGSLALAAFGYLRGVLRMDRGARGRVFGLGRYLAFAAGLGTLVLALVSPLDALDDQLFSAHMVQHMLLMLVAPPLLVWGRPATAWLWAFRLPSRRAIGRWWMRTPGLARGVRALLGPLSVWLLSSFALWFWHLPGPYRWALDNEWVHTGEHLCFFLTALAFWSLVLAPYGRRQLAYGPSLLFVGTLGVQMGLLGAILTFAARPVYMLAAGSTAAWGLSPLEDQQLAGVIMWVPAGFVYVAAMAFLFVAWLADAERKSVAAVSRGRANGRGLRMAGLALMTVSLVALGGCQEASPDTAWRISGADPTRGPALIVAYGCDACHTIPGVRAARGTVGPPLTQFGRRAFIAGTLHNEPSNLILWLRHPQRVLPGNAMPDTGLTPDDARDIAAYLYTLQ